MHKVFEKKSFLAYLLCTILFFLFSYKLFSTTHFYVDKREFLVFNSLFNTSDSNNAILRIVSLVLFFISLVNVFNLLKQKDFSLRFELFAIYAMLIHGIIALSFKHSILDFIHLFYISLLILQLGKLNRVNRTVGDFFNIGLIYGLFLIATSSLVIYIPILILCVNVFGKSGFKDLWSLIFGLIAPIYIVFSVLYLTDANAIVAEIIHSFRLFKYQLATYWMYLPLVLVILNAISAAPLITNFNINSRKLFTIIFSLMILYSILSVNIVFGQTKLILSLVSVGALYVSIFINGYRNEKVKNLLLVLGFLWAIINTFVIK